MSTSPNLTVTPVEENGTPEVESWVTLDSLDEFLAAIGRYPLLTPAEEVALAKRIERGDKGARRRMIECNLRLVVVIAKDYRHGELPFLDVIQEGMVGLIHAADGFDWRLGNRFSTYARWWIQQSIRTGLARSSRTVRLPVRLAARARQIERTTAALATKLGRQPTESELCTALELSSEQLRRARMAAASQVAVSIDAPASEDGRPLVESIADEADDFRELASEAFEDATDSTIGSVLAELPDRTRRVLELRYGLDGSGARSYRDVARAIGVSVARIRHIEARALHHLRHREDVRALKAA